MNIFILDTNIQKCAEYHVDKHVIKMITESAQLLSSAVRLCGIDEGYKLTHQNHPPAIWARESLSNWLWLRDLTSALNDEYRYRYNKMVDHRAFTIAMRLPIPPLIDIGITPFRLTMPDVYKGPDAIEAYRKFYIGEKRHIANWRNRNVPPWWE